MAEVIVTEKKSRNALGFVYTWKCPDCENEWHHLKDTKQTFLECSCCGLQVLRTGKDKDEWETK